MTDDKKQYLSLLSEIIAASAIIFGPDLAILQARSIAGLGVDNNGKVTDIQGYAADTAKELVDSYMVFSGQAMKNIIDSIFLKYPQIRRID